MSLKAVSDPSVLAKLRGQPGTPVQDEKLLAVLKRDEARTQALLDEVHKALSKAAIQIGREVLRDQSALINEIRASRRELTMLLDMVEKERVGLEAIAAQAARTMQELKAALSRKERWNFDVERDADGKITSVRAIEE